MINGDSRILCLLFLVVIDLLLIRVENFERSSSFPLFFWVECVKSLSALRVELRRAKFPQVCCTWKLLARLWGGVRLRRGDKRLCSLRRSSLLFWFGVDITYRKTRTSRRVRLSEFIQCLYTCLVNMWWIYIAAGRCCSEIGDYK